MQLNSKYNFYKADEYIHRTQFLTVKMMHCITLIVLRPFCNRLLSIIQSIVYYSAVYSLEWVVFKFC
jgi:hypothetical protein